MRPRSRNRNPKSEGRIRAFGLRISAFGFPSDFGFRISDLPFGLS